MKDLIRRLLPDSINDIIALWPVPAWTAAVWGR